MPPAKNSLVSKIAAIAAEIGDQEPKRHGGGIKFPYHAARDVYGWWRPKLHAVNVILIPKVRSVDVQAIELPRSGGGTRKTFLTTIIMDFTLIDGETGEIIEGTAVGQGEDPSDKGSGKAMTYAEKSFLLGLGMNGADTDVEAVASHTNDYDSAPDVRVESSNIEGIERGGRSSKATDVQVQRVRHLTAQLGFDIPSLNGIVDQVFGAEVQLPDDVDDHGPAMRRYLESLPADEIGKLIQYLDMMAEAKNM